MTENSEVPVPHCEEPVSIFGSWDVTTLNESLLTLAVLSTLAPHRLMLAVALSPRGFNANLSVMGYIVGGLLDGSLPCRHSSQGTVDGTTGLQENLLQTITPVAFRSRSKIVN